MLHTTAAVEASAVTVLAVPLLMSWGMAAVVVVVRRYTGRTLKNGDGKWYLNALAGLYLVWFYLLWVWLGDRWTPFTWLVVGAAVAVVVLGAVGASKSNP